ncbi:MAG: VOC family protein, partial [Acidobacteria bacterium]|nr:VOC family protein [Acidobacteriota bacterium]
MANRVTHFEIHAENPERAIAFYRQSLGWEFQSWGGPMPYWLITTGPADQPGINGGLVPRRGDAPAEMAAVNAYVCTVMTEAIDATSEAILANGGTV